MAGAEPRVEGGIEPGRIMQQAAAPHRLGRRHFLSLAAGSVGGLALSGLSATGASAQQEPFGFALLGDTHVGLTVPHRTEWVSWVYEHIAARDASVVCHVGDIMDYGSIEEYETYLGTIPDQLRPRMRHVPGNHEWRWDPTARERYHELLGDTRYSFDVGGVHFIALNPSHLLQEGGGFGEHGMAWLLDELDRVPSGAPIILLCHFPFGFDNYYVSDQQRLLEVLHAYNVRAIFAGHIHNEQIHRFNGVTQLAVNGSLNAPLYYWLERETGPDGPVLRITEVRRDIEDEEATITREVGTIALGGPRIARDERPQAVDLSAGAGALSVAVQLRPPAAGATVEAQLYPQHTYAVKNPGQWQTLQPDGRRHTGALDVSNLPPGSHRMTVKVIGSGGAWHEETHGFTLPGSERIRWQIGLGAPIQAGLARYGDTVVAATTGGVVVAGRATGSGLDELWRAQTGGVKGRPVFSPDGETVYVPSVDHRVYALDAAAGTPRFAYNAGEPVLGSPLFTEIAGTAVLVVGTGQSVQALDATSGDRRWSTTEAGMFTGRPAADSERVYTGGGNAYAHAFDAATGETVWSFLTNLQQSDYRRLIYGPWYDNVELLPDGLVLVSTVSNAHALDVATGEERWRLPGSYVFAPKVFLDPDLLVIDDWARTVSRLDPADGSLRWTASIGVRALNTGAAVHDGLAWVHGTTGQLTAVDLETGAIAERLQVTATANCYSTPVIAGDVLVVGDQDGVLHGIVLTT